MAVFTYKGRTSEGSFEEGSLEAEDRAGALRQLHEQNFVVQGLEAAGVKLSSGRKRGQRATSSAAATRSSTSSGTSGNTKGETPAAPGLASLFVRVPIRQRCGFWRQAHQGQRAGMTIDQTLELMSSGPGRLAEFARQSHASMGRGRPLSELMAEHATLFAPLEVAMVRAGEANGRLDVQMDRLAQIYEREMDVRNSLRWRMAYLGCQWVALVGCLFSVTVIAPIVRAFMMGERLGVGGKLASFALPFVVVLGALALWRGSYASSGKMRLTVDRFKLSAPVLGPLFRKIAIARYARALGDLIGAGLPAGEAASIAAPTCGNLWLTQTLAELPAVLRGGTPLSEALIRTCAMPHEVVQMVRTGEHSGSIDQMLDRVATYYEQEAVAATQTLVYVGFAGGILLFGAIAGIYIVHFWMSYFGGLFNDF